MAFDRVLTDNDRTSMRQRGVGVLALSVALPGAAGAGAAPRAPADVPQPLRTWVPWAMHGHETERCPTLGTGDDAVCAWAGALTLALDDRGGRFAQEWEV